MRSIRKVINKRAMFEGTWQQAEKLAQAFQGLAAAHLSCGDNRLHAQAADYNRAADTWFDIARQMRGK